MAKQTKLTPELTNEELETYQIKADELAKREKVSKVHPVVLINPETFERIVAYISEPNYLTKIRVMDKMTTAGAWTASDELRQACTIIDVSDPLTYGEGPECDEFKMGLVKYCSEMVRIMQNQFKKK